MTPARRGESYTRGRRALGADMHSRTTCTRGIGPNGLFQAKHADTLGPNHRARAKTDTLGPKLSESEGHRDPGQAGGQRTLGAGLHSRIRSSPKSGTLLTIVL